MSTVSQEANKIWQRFVVRPGASVQGTFGIASAHAIGGIIDTILRQRPKTVLEIGAGIGTLTYTILRTATDLAPGNGRDLELITIEKHPFCLEQLEKNLACYEGRYRIEPDSGRLRSENRSFDFIVVDGGAGAEGRHHDGCDGGISGDMGVTDFSGMLNRGGSILVEGFRLFQRERIKEWYGDRDYVYMKSTPLSKRLTSTDGRFVAKNNPYHIFHFEPTRGERFQLRLRHETSQVVDRVRWRLSGLAHFGSDY